MNEKRYFVAVPLPPEMKSLLSDWCARRRSEYSFRKWVYEQDYHMTLKYLGACRPEQVRRLKARIYSITCEQRPFSLTLSGIGSFGRKECPRILWSDVDGELTALHRLQARTEEVMAGEGYVEDRRPYRPHVTLAKNCRSETFSLEPLASAWDREMVIPDWDVRSIALYRTELGRQPMYVSEIEANF